MVEIFFVTFLFFGIFIYKSEKNMNVREIVLDCSYTYYGEDIMDNGKCLFDYIIHRDGVVRSCGNVIGNRISVCYVGGIGIDGKTVCDTRTIEQREALLELVCRLMDEYGITLDNVYCKFVTVMDFRDEYMNWVSKKVFSKI